MWLSFSINQEYGHLQETYQSAVFVVIKLDFNLRKKDPEKKKTGENEDPRKIGGKDPKRRTEIEDLLCSFRIHICDDLELL